MNKKTLFSLIGLVLPLVFLPTVNAMTSLDGQDQNTPQDTLSEAVFTEGWSPSASERVLVNELANNLCAQFKYIRGKKAEIIAGFILIAAKQYSLDPNEIGTCIAMGHCPRCNKITEDVILIVGREGIGTIPDIQKHRCLIPAAATAAEDQAIEIDHSPCAWLSSNCVIS